MNSRPESQFEDIDAWLDGELGESERSHVTELLESDPAAQAWLQEAEATRALLGRLPQYKTPKSFALTSEMLERNPSPSNVIRLLPITRVLAVAAVLMFLVTGTISAWNAFSDDETNSTADASDLIAEEDSSGLVDRGESASSQTETEESGAPGASEATPASLDEETEATEDDETSIWVYLSVGFGVLALALIGYWVYLSRSTNRRT